MAVYKTKKNLQELWQMLDDACGSLDNAFFQIHQMSGLPDELIQKMEKIDFSTIVSLKNSVEELLEKKK